MKGDGEGTLQSPGLVVDRRFRRREHLKKKVEIAGVFKKGRAVSCSGAKLFFLNNELPHNRVVITFARKYGNAVERNRARRLNREAYRLMRENLKTGYDLVILIYPRLFPKENGKVEAKPGFAGKVSFSDSNARLRNLFTKAGLEK
ncbi:MAG: ribonuclease P protein component [Treponema sp.]|jgi:ribonuclease P protein component|nr:ribonuclease P protein component [Treponema sp.]